MIDLEVLAEVIEEGLSFTADTITDGEGLTFPYGDGGRVSYVFRVVADTTEYKRPTRYENDVTVYIHGLLMQTGSNIETAQGDVTNALINTSLEVVVPVFSGMDDEGNQKLVSTVRKILDDFFSKNGNGDILFGEERYSYGFAYNLAASGNRALRAPVGDSFNFRITSTWYFLKYGIPTSDIKLYFVVNGAEIVVPYKTIGLLRNAVQETDVPSTSTNAVGKNIVASTMLTLTVGMDTVGGAVYSILNSFLFDGDNTPILVRMKRPSGIGSGTSQRDYLMVFNEVTLNGQIPLYASNTFKMVEVL